jgi:deoxynucleoside triphosphate triphosphohydrolase SAMHD1
MNYKLINDTIYGQISLSNIAIKIIDTPQFQKLRNIKQLGACSFIFPTASHTRFEHSIGVAHLAKEFLQSLVQNSENIEATEEDYLLVEIAGLCHDLGHGPFSHAFDNEVLADSNSKYAKHEERSIMLLKYIVETYNINLTNQQVENISEMIHPSENNNERSFIYSIVSNSINSLDVDKIDYIQRDILNLAIENGYNHSRLFKMCRVIDNEVCIHKKEAFNLYEFFRLRYRLHKQMYNHPAVKAHEYMIADIFGYLDKDLHIKDIIDDSVEFTKYTDSILDTLYFLPENENTKMAKELMNRIKTRDLYTFIDEYIISDENIYLNKKQKIIERLSELHIREELIIHELNIGLSGSDMNPIENVRFFDKYNDNIRINPSDISLFIGNECRELTVRFFIKTTEHIDLIKEVIYAIM